MGSVFLLFSIFRKWARRVTLSLCLDGHPWEIWIHLQGSSDLNGEIMSRHQEWGPMLSYSRKSLGLYELQVENHQTLTWETYSSHCITSYVLLSNNHDSMCTLVSPEKVIKTAFKICQKITHFLDFAQCQCHSFWISGEYCIT